MSTSRGIRNNNPGNIDFNPRNKWNGQLGLEVGVPRPRFARFDEPENGIRALGRLLLNYRGKDGMPGVGGPGIDTVRETINRWAPGHENDTEAYIASVAKALRVKPNDIIDVRKPDVLRTFVVAIIKHENGAQPYKPEVIEEGIRRALA
ncbi:structural protein P5 [Pseudomonas sp. PA15(2017)]|uniref:structural protein P5 n=1 Tax=Pseudomonas sp. PA15(2017) TaxID=1932111 RepID=UPI00095D587B|nr:structural protein P5 [Pseudomonas sp. PA15(2017)]OLU22931.1 structural protein P5 [Pseudomonas sp. PA15(2017)]